MAIVKVLAKGQVVIPASVRKKYDIHPGSKLHIFEYGISFIWFPLLKMLLRMLWAVSPQALHYQMSCLKNEGRILPNEVELSIR